MADTQNTTSTTDDEFQRKIAESSQMVAPQVPEDNSFDGLMEHFGPIFDEIAEGASEREFNRVLPFEQITKLNRAGFGTLRVPQAFGGVGASIETFIRLLIELGAADPNIAHQYRSHAGFVDAALFASDEAQEHFYSQVLQGMVVGNASTEIGGNALGTLNTTLQLAEDGSGVLNGKKYYATGSAFATHTRVSASIIQPDGSVDEGRGFALVPTTAEGITLLDDWDGFGQRLTATGTAIFDNVAVDAKNVIPRQPGSIEAVHEAPFFQIVLMAVTAGIGKAALKDATVGVRNRKRTFNTGLGLPYREDPLILETVGRMSSQVFAATAAVVEAARALDRAFTSLEDPQAVGTDVPQEYVDAEVAVDSVQVVVPEQIIKVTSDLFLTGGASNTLRPKNLDRHWRNAQTVATHNPISFRARAIGDWEVNGTPPEGLNAIGDAKTTEKK